MSRQTTNYGLTKPDYTDTADIEVVNANMDIIDGALKVIDTKSNNVMSKNSSAWSSTVTYAVGQYCIYNNSLWKCLVQHSGQTPQEGTYWARVSLDTLDSEINALNSNIGNRTRTNITNNLSNLSQAVAEQNLEKYGYSIGDYFTGASGYEYTLADMDTYYGGYNNNAIVSRHHIGILVNTKQQSKYQESGNVTSYANSTLHSFLTTTVLDKVKSDFTTLFGNWNNHLLAHNLLNNSIGDWGTPAWIENNYIEALTEVQIYGSRVFGADSYQTGTGCKKLTVFDKFRYNQILGNIWFWLRSLSSASSACVAYGDGNASYGSVGSSHLVVALILFY